jgi:hypothetical protein
LALGGGLTTPMAELCGPQPSLEFYFFIFLKKP